MRKVKEIKNRIIKAMLALTMSVGLNSVMFTGGVTTVQADDSWTFYGTIDHPEAQKIAYYVWNGSSTPTSNISYDQLTTVTPVKNESTGKYEITISIPADGSYSTSTSAGYILFFVEPNDGYLFSGLGASGAGEYYVVGSNNYGNINSYPGLSYVLNAAEGKDANGNEVAEATKYVAMFGWNRVASAATEKMEFEINTSKPSLGVTASSSIPETSTYRTGTTVQFDVTLAPTTTATNATIKKDSSNNDLVNLTSTKINGTAVEHTALTKDTTSNTYKTTITYVLTDADCDKQQLDLEVDANVTYTITITNASTQATVTTDATISEVGTINPALSFDSVKHASYSFTSGTTGKDLPESITSQVPVNNYETTEKPTTTFEDVIVYDTTDTSKAIGKWTFTGWSDGTDTAYGKSYVGTWTYADCGTINITVPSVDDAKKNWDGQPLSVTPTADVEGVTLTYETWDEAQNKWVAYTGTGAPTRTDAGTTKIRVTASKAGYFNASEEYSIEVLKVNASGSTNGTESTYDGSAKSLVKDSTATGGTIYYKVDGEDSYSTEVPTRINAGTYTIYYYVKGDGNHNDNPTEHVPASVTAKINQATASATLKANDITWDGTEKDLATESDTKGGTVYYSLDGKNYTTDIPKVSDAGKYTIYYYVKSNDTNYKDDGSESQPKTLEVEVKKAASVADTTGTTNEYDGSEKDLLADTKVTGGTIYYKVGENGTWTTESPKATNVGKYTVYYYVKGDANHADDGSGTAPHSVKATITPADSITTVTGDNRTYDGTTKALVTESKTTGGTVYYSLDGKTYSTSIPEVSEAGKYTVYYYVEGDENHSDYGTADEPKTVEVEVKKAASSTEVKSNNFTYDGTSKKVVTAFNTVGGTVYYSLDGKTYSEGIPQLKDAGTYTIYYYVKGDANHSDYGSADKPYSVQVKITEQKTANTSDSSNTLFYGLVGVTSVMVAGVLLVLRRKMVR